MPKIKPFEELTIMDDYMFGVVVREEKNLKPLLEAVLNVKIEKIEFIEPQKSAKEGYLSKGIRLDLYVLDESSQIYNAEVQTSDKKNLPKRMRYYQSVIDINILAPGVDYNKLKKSFVIFICNYDPFGKGRYLYRFENRCVEDLDLAFGDESVKVVLNTKGTVGIIREELRQIIEYLGRGIVNGAYTEQLNHAVQDIKCIGERRHEYMVMMIREMEIREEGREEGRAEGREEGRQEGREEERANTVRERQRAERAEKELEEIKAELESLKSQMK